MFAECVFCSAHRRHAGERHSAMLVEAAILAPKPLTAKGGATR